MAYDDSYRYVNTCIDKAADKKKKRERSTKKKKRYKHISSSQTVRSGFRLFIYEVIV